MGTLGCHNGSFIRGLGHKDSYIILFIGDAICLKSLFFVKIYKIFNILEISKKLTYT